MFKFLKGGQNGGNSYNQLYAEKAFDFYGQEIRLHKDEAKRAVQLKLLKLKDNEIESQREEI